jgi:hypothetical protein
MNDQINLTYDFDTITLEIKPPRSSSFTLFCATLMVFMTIAFVFSIIQNSNTNAIIPFLLWGLAILLTGYLLLCNFFARVIVTVDTENLSIKDDVLGMGFSKSFKIKEIKNFRVANFFDKVSTPTASGLLHFRFYDGKVAFEHNDKTYRFGSQINHNDAIIIAEKFKNFIKKINYDKQIA